MSPIKKHLGITFFLVLLLTFLPFASAQAQTVGNQHAAAQLQTEQIRPGSDITFKMKLDQPLPQGAHFDVRLSPVDLGQEFPVTSGEPSNRERTEFTLHTKIPEGAATGEWHIKIVYLFLAGTSWTQSTISTNDMRFVVQGPKVDIPTKATATLLSK
jgi:hypothetical protein